MAPVQASLGSVVASGMPRTLPTSPPNALNISPRTSTSPRPYPTEHIVLYETRIVKSPPEKEKVLFRSKTAAFIRIIWNHRAVAPSSPVCYF